MSATERTRGIGSEFHWMGLSSGAHFSWHPTAQFFARGRDTLLALWQSTAGPDSRLWIPAFFCPEVIQSLREAGVKVASYLDHPTRSTPDWTTLDAKPHDLVLAVNFFGIQNPAPWTRWKQQNPDVVLIEDHTHDPASLWARASQADFAMASLRKTMPVPDGAVVWSPLDRPVPIAQRYDAELRSSHLYLAAMIIKSQYLQSREEHSELRERYRQLEQSAAEVPMGRKPRSLSPAGTSFLAQGVCAERRAKRGANCRLLLDELDLARIHDAGAAPLFVEWPQGHCPLNPILLCADRRSRDQLRERLIAARVYPPIHWPIDQSPWPEISQMSERILTLPVDFRCSDVEVRAIAQQLNQFFQTFVNAMA